MLQKIVRVQIVGVFVVVLALLFMNACASDEMFWEPDGDESDGDGVDGDIPDGDQPDGDQPDGDQPDGDQPDGDQPDGDQPDGDQPDGDLIDGDDIDGDIPDGDEDEDEDGDTIDGDQPDGDEDGDTVDGDQEIEIDTNVDRKQVVVLYEHDPNEHWSYGRMFSVVIRNLLGHFATEVNFVNVEDYQSGLLATYDAGIYIGTVWDTILPTDLLYDVYASDEPFLWVDVHIDQLFTAVGEDAEDKYGFAYDDYLEGELYDTVYYKGEAIAREAEDYYFTGVTISDSSKCQVLAYMQNDTTTRPYLLRSGKFFYFVNNPFAYMANDVVIFADVLHDFLDTVPIQPQRALVRLEDIAPSNVDNTKLMAVADALYARGVPFAVGVIPVYIKPDGSEGSAPRTVSMEDDPDFISLMRYLESKGGTLIQHGYTHQYDGTTGVDFEFWEEVNDTPIPEDSWSWALGRVDAGIATFKNAMGRRARIWETPHYAASYLDYFVFAQRFQTMFEQLTVYDSLKVLSEDDQAYDRNTVSTTMTVPYELHDTFYGLRVIPENLGYFHEGELDSHGVTEDGAGKIFYATQYLTVRDATVALFFHHWQQLSELIIAVEGIEDLGYVFVDVAGVAHSGYPPFRHDDPSDGDEDGDEEDEDNDEDDD